MTSYKLWQWAGYLVGLIGRLLFAPLILFFTTIQFVVNSVLALGRWIFTGKGVRLRYGFIQIG